jgi:hypothetical protein
MDWALYTDDNFGNVNDIVMDPTETYMYVGGFLKRNPAVSNKYTTITSIDMNGAVQWTYLIN